MEPMIQRGAARFDAPTATWRTAESASAIQAKQLRCVTFNVWFDDFAFVERGTALLNLLQACNADVIALQEVTPPLLEQILETDWIRQQYAVSDHTGATVGPYGVLLLSRWTPLHLQWHPLPSDMGRQLLVATFDINGIQTQIATVHLESLRYSAAVRATQLAHIFPTLASAPHAILMGDFNFCSAWADEQANLDPAYCDVWPALHPDEPGYSEDTVINRMLWQKERKHKQVRFDRILLRSSAPGWVPQTMQVLGTTPIRMGLPYIFPSDHFGLEAIFTWV
jgi:tyrosyl-DNA phosphodiesterase 2